MPKYIYFVGKPYPYASVVDIIRAQGYKIGIFLDKNIKLPSLSAYDDVINVDFSSPRSLFASFDSEKLKIDGLICTYENYIVAKSRLAEHFKVAAPSLKSSQMCTDKYLMRQAFMRADPAITPKFGLVATEEEVLELARQLGYPLILKPTNLVKSLLVLRCNNERQLLSNFAYAQDKITELYEKYKIYERQPQLIVEEYIEGKTCSIAAFVDQNGTAHFCEGIVSLTNAQDIGVDDNYIYERMLPAELNEELAARLFDVSRKGIAALDMTSAPAHVELVYNNQDVKLIEIGARIGGYRPRMYNLSFGLDLISQEIRLALRHVPDLMSTFKAYTAVYELFPETEGEFVGVEGDADTSKFTYYAIKAKAGKAVGPAKNGYKAAAIIIVSHRDKAEFLRISQSVKQLKIITH